MEIYIIRHGETLWNRERKLQGMADTELSDEGRRAAKLTGEALKNTDIDVIYSSPLKRAYETACLIRGERNIEIRRDDRLKEINFGGFEGKNMDALISDEKCSFRYFFDEPSKYVPDETGESLEHLCRRTADFMREEVIKNADKYKRIMIIGHGAMNKSIMCFIKKHGIDKFWSGGLQKNCNVILVRYENEKFYVVDEEKVFY